MASLASASASTDSNATASGTKGLSGQGEFSDRRWLQSDRPLTASPELFGRDLLAYPGSQIDYRLLGAYHQGKENGRSGR